MSIFSSFGVNASGMTAQRYRMDIISQNVANANTTRTEDGTPYRRKVVTFREKTMNPTEFGTIFRKSRGMDVGDGVKVSGVYEDKKEDMKLVYDPSHPDADEYGYVTYPNVNIVTEMTNMIDSTRAYEANATAFNASKTIAMKGLDIGRSSEQGICLIKGTGYGHYFIIQRDERCRCKDGGKCFHQKYKGCGRRFYFHVSVSAQQSA